MSPETYAAALVNHVIGSSPGPWFWKGTNATVTWIVSTFAPKTAFVSPASGMRRQGTNHGMKGFLMKRISGLENAREEILRKASKERGLVKE